MEKPYQSIPTQGTHRDTEGVPDQNASVRSPNPSDVEATGRPVDPTYQLLKHKEQGIYRLRAWQTDEIEVPEDTYQEQGRYRSHEWADALQPVTESEHFVVFENTGTGEVYFDRERNLSADWTGGGRFDVVTVFEDEEAAETYARQRSDTKAE